MKARILILLSLVMSLSGCGSVQSMNDGFNEGYFKAVKGQPVPVQKTTICQTSGFGGNYTTTCY